MKRFLAVLALVLVGGAALRADEPRLSRSYSTYGAVWTSDLESPFQKGSFGGLARSFTFFDASSSQGGWYYGMGASFGGTVGGVLIADTWLGTLGWMGNPLELWGRPAVDFDVNLSASPTLGSRIVGREVKGFAYLGAGFSVGLSTPLPFTLPLVGDGSVGLSWDPVVPIAALWGSQPVAHQGYANFVLTWTTKRFTETRVLPWKGPQSATTL